MLLLLIVASCIISACAERSYYNVRYSSGPRRGQFMRRRTTSEVDEFNRNGFIRRGEIRSRSNAPEAYARRRAFVQDLWNRRRAARAARTSTLAPTPIPTRVEPRPDDKVWYLGGWATRQFRDEREAELKRERDAERLQRFRDEIMERSQRRSY